MIEQELVSVPMSPSASEEARSRVAQHDAIEYDPIGDESYMYREAPPFSTNTTGTTPYYTSRIFMEQTQRRIRRSRIPNYMILGSSLVLLIVIFVSSSYSGTGNNSSKERTISSSGGASGGATIQDEPVSMFKTSTTSATTTATTASTSHNSNEETYNNLCYEVCEEHKNLRYYQDDGDLLKVEDMLQLALRAKAGMIEKLKVDYGDAYFYKIFEKEQSRDENSRQFFSKILGNNYARNKNTKKNKKKDYNIPYRGVEPVTTPTSSTTGSTTSEIYDDATYTRTGSGESLQRLKRKFYIKLLEVQLAIQHEESNINGCNCIHGTKIPIEEKKEEDEEKETTPTPKSSSSQSHYSNFVWATGGASIAAGHGNLFNETYTAFLERAVKGVFASVGIDFEARNHAIGGISSGYEVSMCSEAIFGTDVDILSWDFGMTDGRMENKLRHFGYRAGLNPGRPALLAMHLGERPTETARRLASLQELETMGLAVFWASQDIATQMENEIPDMVGLAEEQIKEYPDYIRSFKCAGQLEKGQPHCADEKYNLAICPHRSGKAAWHPGVKAHALDGNKFGLFLVEILLDSIIDLNDMLKERSPEVVYNAVKADEEILFQSFAQASLPELARNNFEADNDIDVGLVFKGPTFCHTALLPAQTRYSGYLTNSQQVGSAAPVGEETYDVGISKDAADQTNADGELRLVYDSNGRHNCPVPLRVDYRDYFYAHSKDGRVSLTIPNEAEREAYNYDPSSLQGMIIVFFGACEWGKCMAGEVNGDKVEEGKFEIDVNGDKVTSWSTIGDDGTKSGYVMKGQHGIFWNPNDDGVYELTVRVTEPDSFVRFSSFVIY